MDTTPKYIKMSDCPEIQDGWKLESGDKFWVRSSGLIGTVDFPPRYPSMFTWLPRQDQLQEMIDKEVGHILAAFFWWATRSPTGHTTDVRKTHSCDTMEQLWLAFVMREKYRKRWDGEKEVWCNINTGG